MHTKVIRGTAAAIATLTTLTVLGACTSNSGAGRTSDLIAGSAGGDYAASVPSPQQGAASAGPNANGSVDDGSSASGSRSNAALTDLTISSAKIRTASMSVEVKRGESVAAKADSATTIALRVGGEVDSDDRSSGKNPTATLLLRVPPDQLQAVLTELSQLGNEQSRQLSTEDVTSKVADVSSRVDSAREAIARLRDLYAHAVKVSDVITIESELAGRQSDLESLEAQQRALSAQTATAAVTLSLTSAPPRTTEHHPAKKDDRSGFVGGLKDGWDAFARGAGAVATATGAVLPFAVLLLVLGFAARLLWPRLRPVRRPEPMPAPPQ